MIYQKQTFDTAHDDTGTPWFCVRYETTEFSQPFKVTHWWPIAPIADCGPGGRELIKEAIGQEAQDRGQGLYVWRRAAYDYLDFWLKDRGQTKPIKTVREAYPCPKTRKGILTRFYSGWWQKFTKADGWQNML